MASGDTVFVAPGDYLASSETFPLVVPAGVTMIGDEASRGGNTTRILGCGANTFASGSVAVVLRAGSTVAGFTINCGSTGIYAPANGVIIRNNTVTGNTQDSGIWIDGGNDQTIVLNAVTGNNFGIHYINTTAGGKAENNLITSNVMGFLYQTPSASLGDPANPTVSVGNNTISCNTTADLYLSPSGAVPIASINAAFNRWDHSPPTASSSTASGGIDIYNPFSSSVNVSGSLLAPSPCP